MQKDKQMNGQENTYVCIYIFISYIHSFYSQLVKKLRIKCFIVMLILITSLSRWEHLPQLEPIWCEHDIIQTIVITIEHSSLFKHKSKTMTSLLYFTLMQ